MDVGFRNPRIGGLGSAQSAGSTQQEGLLDLRLIGQHVDRPAGDLSAGAEDEDVFRCRGQGYVPCEPGRRAERCPARLRLRGFPVEGGQLGQRLTDGLGLVVDVVVRVLVTNADETMISAGLQGVGLVQRMDWAVRDYVAAGGLVRVPEGWRPPFEGFDLYLPSREQMAPKLRALVDFLVEKRRGLEADAV